MAKCQCAAAEIDILKGKTKQDNIQICSRKCQHKCRSSNNYTLVFLKKKKLELLRSYSAYTTKQWENWQKLIISKQNHNNTLYPSKQMQIKLRSRSNPFCERNIKMNEWKKKKGTISRRLLKKILMGSNTRYFPTSPPEQMLNLLNTALYKWYQLDLRSTVHQSETWSNGFVRSLA